MNSNLSFEADGEWLCAKCACPLEQKMHTVTYLGSAFDVTLPTCPQCGAVLVPESLALGKMAEVESLLEDK